ncbi:MAG: hypothetical protein IJD40_01225 [Lachnospiraceae bacterium]|nr:hypothetical protein [Lachnospiraceae bacterium]
MSNENNVLLYDKSKVNHEEASGSLVPSLSNDSPYFNEIIEQNKADVKVKSSIKRETSVSEDASNYILDTKEYQDIIKIVDQRYKLTNKKKLSPKAIDRLAGKLLTKASSKYDREQLTTRLTALFDWCLQVWIQTPGSTRG